MTDAYSSFNLKPATAAAAPDAAAPDPYAGFNLQPAKQNPGILKKMGGWISSIKDAVVGQNEFDYPEVSQDLTAPVDDRDMRWARGDEGLKDVIRKQAPDAVFSKDKFGNDIVTMNVEGKPVPYYINRSGVSGRDIDELGRDTLLTLPFSAAAGAITKAMPFLVRAGAQAGAGAAGSLASDAGSTLHGSEQGLDFAGLIFSALGGAGGEALGSLGAAVINRIRNAPHRYVDSSGQLTPLGQEVFVKAGLDPGDVTKAIADEFAKRARTTGPNPSTAREVAAGEFGLPITRGMATGDFDQIAFEQAAKAGARGEVAGDVMRDKFGRLNSAIEDSKSALADELAPKVRTPGQYDSADVVAGGLRAREDAHGQMANAAWDQAREDAKGAFVPKASVRELPKVAKDALRSDPRFYTPDDATDLYPATLQAMKLFQKWGDLDIGEITTKTGTGVTPQGVALELMDEFRKMLSGKGGLLGDATKPGDRVRLTALVKAFNGWIDGVVDDGLLKGGSPEAWKQFKNARAASAKHFSLFGENNTLDSSVDKAGRTLERMIGEDVTSSELANWMWGKGKIGEGGEAYRLAKRLQNIFPADSEEWQAMRRGMWQRVVSEAEGKNQPGAQAVAQNVLEFVNGRGRALAGVLFEPEELAKMRRYASVLKNTVPPPDATNPSKSGYELARAIGGASVSTSSLPVRLFLRITDQSKMRNLGSTASALTTGGGAPVVRTPPSPLVPAATAAGTGEGSRE